MRRTRTAAILVLGAAVWTGCDYDLDLTGLDLWGTGGGWGGPYPPMKWVEVKPAGEVAVGDSVQFQAVYHPGESEDTTQGTFTWSVSDTQAVALGRDGWAIARLPGLSFITAEHDSSGTAGSAEVRVVATPVDVEPAPLSSVAAGGGGCGLTADGEAYCWGFNGLGELGIGRRFEGGRATATRVGGSERFSTLHVGQQSTCGLTAQGRAYCWGANAEGSLGTGDYEPRFEPTAVRSESLFVSLSVSPGHACAVTSSGAALCWGGNFDGQLGTGGQHGAREPAEVSGGIAFRSVTVGVAHSCGLDVDGVAYCWGVNYDGQLGIGDGDRRLVPTPVAGDGRYQALAALGWGTCALDGEGRIHCWGSPVAGEGGRVPVPLGDGRSYASLTGGMDHACALTEDGAAYCWGANWDGQLGDGTFEYRAEPVRVAGGLRFTSISAGEALTCGVATDGQAYCWGANYFGSTGTGTLERSALPAPVVRMR